MINETGDAADRDVDPEVARLADEIRLRRTEANLSHAQLAAEIGYSRQYLSLAERPRKGLPSSELVRALDGALRSGGVLIALRERAAAARRTRRRAITGMARIDVPTLTSSTRGHEVTVEVGPDVDNEFSVHAPAGRFFAGTAIAAKVYPAVDDGRLLVTVPPGFAEDVFLRRPRRGLVIGANHHGASATLYGLDTRHVRRRLAGAPGQTRLLMTRAYALDDLTLGLLWAVSNLEEALLDDDALLEDSTGQLAAYEDLHRSAVGREIAADLAIVSRMWLGSLFCANHILRNASALAGAPVFWTREQRGEEASTWLLFAHKYAYLRQSSQGATRTFCVPQSAVTESSSPERVLLFLAAALMASFDITVHVTTEPEYAALPGFVFDGRRNAIVANWVGADGVWQVDVTDATALVREFADASEYARVHSVMTGDTPGERLHTLADYLELDWSWLVRRCAELGEYGSAGLVAPRSRLLSTDGIDRACRFVATVVDRTR